MQKFDTPAPITVVLDVPAGLVRFIAADRADSVVDVRPADPSKSRDVKAAEQVEIGYRDGLLRVTAAEPANRLLGSSGSVEVTVQLPAGSRVEAKAAAGEIRGVGRLGDVAVEVALGPVKLDEAAGGRVVLQSGDVEIGRLTGPAEVSTRKGGIRIAEAVRGSLVLRTDLGAIEVGAAAGVSASLDAGTGHGRIHNALANAGETALHIQATTAQGDITARSL
ncbi:DUF4097 family beta strand repeat-containing protein [Kitasatospora sp. NPDC049285]|uniref:DUF4097 family beta strand repeat-containing protein n=1 Tax=Kitasatospora sp. NPDC049285 TaxID=3157096 RepID=UPI00342D9F8F